MNELKQWLLKNQLEKYALVLEQNDITSLDLLVELTEDDLKSLEFSLGDRKRFMIAAKNLANNSLELSDEEAMLLDSLPYVIAYPLKRTLLEQHPWTKINLLKDTFLNYLKYLGLLSASEFFNSEIKDKGMVALFHKNLMETAFGKWNHYIRECLLFLKQQNHTFFCPELLGYYELVETGSKSKKYKGEIEYQDVNGDTQRIIQSSITSIGMLINFRNRYLGHGQTLDEENSKALWNEYYPIFKYLLEQMNFSKDYLMLKRENGGTYLLHASEITLVDSSIISGSNIWIQNKVEQTFDILPFFIVPGEVSLAKDDKEQILAYESYTGKTIKFFSPEGTEKQTSGKILERLNLILREKQKEELFISASFTKDDFLKRILEENKILVDTLISEKKVIPGVYQNREEIEAKLNEWIGAKASIFFVIAEAGSGKTNLLVELQRQYAQKDLPSLLIRAGRMEKQTLKQQIAYLLNIDFEEGLENFTSIPGSQASPTFILIDGLNEANNAEEIWLEILELSKLFEAGSLKFVVTCRVNTKADLLRYPLSKIEQELLFGKAENDENGLGACSFWLTALNMRELKGAWDNYSKKEKSRFNPQFNFEDLAYFDRGLYSQINNPLILRLFLELYNGKALPKKGAKYLNIWFDWFSKFTPDEQLFLKLLANEVWVIGENELLLDDLQKNEKIKPYLISDIINSPYNRLKNNGWISCYVKDFNGYISFTVEGALLYLLALRLQSSEYSVDLNQVQLIINDGTKLQKTAVESFLSEKALDGDLKLASNLIDAGTSYIDMCLKALLLYIKVFGVKSTIDILFQNLSENDWTALKKLDTQLYELQLPILRKEFLSEVMLLNPFNSKESISFGLKAIPIIEESIALNYLNKIDSSSSVISEDSDLLYQLGNCEKYFYNNDKALYYYKECLNKGYSNLAYLYGRIGSVYFRKVDYDKALEYHDMCLQIELVTLNSGHIEISHTYQNIGMVWRWKGEYEKALEFYEKALKIRLNILGDQHLSVANTYFSIGSTLSSLQRFDEALVYYDKVLKIEVNILGEIHTSVASTYNNIGFTWKNKGDLEKALDNYEKCLKIQTLSLVEGHPKFSATFYNFAGIWKIKGDFDKALKYFEKSLVIRLKIYKKNHADVLKIYDNIGECYEALGMPKLALDYFIQSAEIRKQDPKSGLSHPLTIDSISNAKRIAKQFGLEKSLPDWIGDLN